MLDIHIENYKKIAESSAELIYDEKVKIFEYEALLKEKKEEYEKTFFIKRWLTKNKKIDIDTLNEYINESSNVIKKTKESIKKEHDKLVELCMDTYIEQDNERVVEYNKLKDDLNIKKRIFKIVDNSNTIGINAIEWLIATNKEINNLLVCNQITTSYNHLLIPNINYHLINSLRCIELFKKTISSAITQIKSINEQENVDTFINISNLLKDDKSKSILVLDTKRQIKHNQSEINNALSLLTIAYTMINDERNRWVGIHNKANNEYNRFYNDIHLMVKIDLEKMDIKI